METILQSAIRRYLRKQTNLTALLAPFGQTELKPEALEVLGEKAFPQGHVDLLLKQRVPLGTALKIPIEVKVKKGQTDDVLQLRGYMDEIGSECPAGILVASDFNKKVLAAAQNQGIKLVRYRIASDLTQTPTFDEISQGLTLEP